MPWMFPEGLVSGVFMSACASTHTSPIGSFLSRQWSACAETDPIAIEWSPPSTIGVAPSPRTARMRVRNSRQHEATSCRYFTCSSPTAHVSGSRTNTAPSSCTS